MKIKNRKGSTLALTLIIFAVLMIFATFILNFMVIENKQAMYYQNKTQAYYIARSGAQIVEESIIREYRNDDKTRMEIVMSKITTSPSEVTINLTQLPNFLDSNSTLDVKVWKESDNSKIYIESSSSYNGINNKVNKVIDVKIDPDKDYLNISGDKPIIALYTASENLKAKNWVKELTTDEERSKYPEYIFNPINYSDLTKNSNILPNSGTKVNWGKTGETTNYFVENELIVYPSQIELNGNVNIHIRDYLLINKSTTINYISDSIDSPYKLNIYIYGEKTNGYSLFISQEDYRTIEFLFNGNIFVKTGDAFLSWHKSNFKGNLFINSEKLVLNTQSSSEQYVFEGIIYAPSTILNLGDNDQSSYSHLGYIVVKDIQHKKDKVATNSELKASGESGIDVTEIEIDGTPIMTPTTGYFK